MPAKPMHKIKPWSKNDAVESAVLLSLLRIEQRAESARYIIPFNRWSSYERVYTYMLEKSVYTGDDGELHTVTSHDVNLALKRLFRRGAISRTIGCRGYIKTAAYALNS